MTTITKPDGTLRSSYLVKFAFEVTDLGNFETPFGMPVEAAKTAFIAMMKERAPQLKNVKIISIEPSPIPDVAAKTTVVAEGQNAPLPSGEKKEIE